MFKAHNKNHVLGVALPYQMSETTDTHIEFFSTCVWFSIMNYEKVTIMQGKLFLECLKQCLHIMVINGIAK